MLQQTVIKAVIPVYQSFLSQYPTPTVLASASTEDVRLAVKGLGYYRRFDMLHRAAKTLTLKNPSFVWPKDHEEWIDLPGIGTYTAAAISSITLGLPYGVVDGNVERVLCRIFDLREPGNTPALKSRFQNFMNDLVSHGHAGDVNQAVMELGQVICTPINPTCKICPIKQSCSAYINKSQHLAPAPKIKTKPQDVDMIVLVSQTKHSMTLVRRNHTAKFLKGTLGFPILYREQGKAWTANGFDAPQRILAIADHLNQRRSKLEILGRYRHSITKHRLNVQVVRITESPTIDDSECLPVSKLDQGFVGNLDRKALRFLT